MGGEWEALGLVPGLLPSPQPSCPRTGPSGSGDQWGPWPGARCSAPALTGPAPPPPGPGDSRPRGDRTRCCLQAGPTDKNTGETCTEPSLGRELLQVSPTQQGQ